MFANILVVLSVSMMFVDSIIGGIQPPSLGEHLAALHELRSTGDDRNPIFYTEKCPHIISRAEWGARPSKSIEKLTAQPVPYAFIHHSAGRECFNQSDCAAVVRGYQDFHMDTRGWDDIGYSYVIGGDGSVFEGRGWDRVGAHTYGYNRVGLGFCLAGDFMTHLPPKIQMDTAKQLIACGVGQGKISENYTLRGHRDMVNYTSCPGDAFYKLIQTWQHY